MGIDGGAAEHELDVGHRELGARLDEGMEAAGHHGAGPGAERIGPDHARRHAVEPQLMVKRLGLAAREGEKHGEMVLQVLPDWQVDQRRDAELAQMPGRPNAGQHQDLRRAEGAARHDHLPGGGGAVQAAAPEIFDASGGGAVECNPRRVIAGRRKAVAAEERRPLRMVYWLRPNPSWEAAL
jgi:hypothetical protein